MSPRTKTLDLRALASHRLPALQLGPAIQVIERPQRFPRHRAVRCALNAHALLDWHAQLLAFLPIADGRHGHFADLGKGRSATHKPRRLIERMFAFRIRA